MPRLFCIYYLSDIIYNNNTMGKTIRLIKVLSFIVIILEILLGGVFSIFYFNNFFNFQDIIKPFTIAIIAVSIIVINCLFVWIVTLVLASLRQKTDLHAAEACKLYLTYPLYQGFLPQLLHK